MSSEFVEQFKPHLLDFVEDSTCGSPLIITKDNDCNKISDESWSVIEVNEGLCNTITYDLSIADNTCLQLIHIHQNSLLNIQSLQLSNLPRLSIFITESNVLYKTNELVLSSKD